MSFNEAVATQPEIIRLWVLWLTVVMFLVPLVLLVFRDTRRLGAIVLLSSVVVVVAMQALYAAVGFVRLLGLAHVVVWLPLAVYLAVRLRRGIAPVLPRVAVAVLLASITVSLAFDIVDIVRYAAGDRAPMIPAGAG